jgi:hypothetical protein
VNDLPCIPGNQTVAYADGDQSGTLWICPCGNWQIDLLNRTFLAGQSDPWHTDQVFQALKDRNEAIEDAIWEHELECVYAHHLITQAGIARSGNYSPYVLEPK